LNSAEKKDLQYTNSLLQQQDQMQGQNHLLDRKTQAWVKLR